MGETFISDAKSAAQGTDGNKRLDIQGLRAIAVLTVVAFHSGLPVPGGFIGVDIFFVLSGFVITTMLRREWAVEGRIRFGRFYFRRFKRLTPALALMVAVTVLLSMLVQSPFGDQQNTVSTAIGAMFLRANLVIAQTTGGYFDKAAETNPLLHTWSLSVEEQFYLGFPLVLIMAWSMSRISPRFRLAPIFLISSIVVSSLVLAVLGATGYELQRGASLIGFYGPLSRAWEFAVGALLSLTANTAVMARMSHRTATSLGAVGVMMLCLSLWAITKRTPFPSLWTLLPVVATSMILSAGANKSNAIARMLASAPMVKIGDWSYSIYLWHWPLIVFSALVWPGKSFAPLAAGIFSLVPAVYSFYYVEQPIRSYVPSNICKSVGLVGITILLPLLCIAMLGAGARAKWWVAWPDAPIWGEQDHEAMSQGCIDKPFNPDVCSFGNVRPSGTVLLVGDSQAGAYADGVIEAAEGLGMRTVVSSRSGCPLSTVNTSGTKPLDCPAWQHEVLSYALASKPAAVIIANRSSGYTHPESGWRTFIDRTGRPAISGPGEGNAVTLYEYGLRSVVDALAGAGIAVVVVQNIAEPERLNYVVTLLRRIHPSIDNTYFDPKPTVAFRSRATEAENRVAASTAGVVLYDPIKILCPYNACPLKTPDGHRMYFDTWHLTREGSLMLGPSLRETIKLATRRYPRPE